MKFGKWNLYAYAATLTILVSSVVSGEAQTVNAVRPKLSCSLKLDKPGPSEAAFVYMRPVYVTDAMTAKPYEFAYRTFTCEGLPKNTEVRGWIQGKFKSFPIPGSDGISYVVLSAQFAEHSSRAGVFSLCHDAQPNCGGPRTDTTNGFEFPNLAGLGDVTGGAPQLPIGTDGWKMNYALKAVGNTGDTGKVKLILLVQIAQAQDAGDSHDQNHAHSISALEGARVCITTAKHDTDTRPGDPWCSRSQ
jgi:hypothetical protein